MSPDTLLRIDFPDALHHVTSRGDQREAIFVDDADRLPFLDVLALGCEHFEADGHADCLVGNHCHPVVATSHGNLSVFMRHGNGVETQRFNRRHGKVAHVFRGPSRRSSSIARPSWWRCVGMST